MSLGLFGTIVLDKATTIASDADYNTEYAEHARFGTKPLLQGVGDSLIEKRLHFEFHIDHGVPQARLDELQTMRSAREAGVLVMGGINHGWFVITQLTVTEKWLSDDGQPLWLGVSVTLKEYVNETVTNATPLAVSNGNEPINSQNVSPATQLKNGGQNANPPINTLAQTIAALMQSETLASQLEQQTLMVQTTGLSDAATLQLVQGMTLNVNGFVDSSQSAVSSLSRLGSQSIIDNTLLADCHSLVTQAKAVKDLFNQDNWSDNLPIVIGQVQSVATMGNALFGQVTADIAKNSAWLMLR